MAMRFKIPVKTILGIVCIVLVFVVFLLYYAGMFDRITMSVRTTGQLHVVCRDNIGPYKGTRYVMYDVFKYLTDKRNMHPMAGIGIFYDNPNVVAEKDLHSKAGCVVDSLPQDVAAPYEALTLDSMRAVVGEFKIRSALSNFSGTLKFYSGLGKYAHKNNIVVGSPIIEVYDMTAHKILYIAPIK